MAVRSGRGEGGGLRIGRFAAAVLLSWVRLLMEDEAILYAWSALLRSAVTRASLAESELKTSTEIDWHFLLLSSHTSLGSGRAKQMVVFILVGEKETPFLRSLV